MGRGVLRRQKDCVPQDLCTFFQLSHSAMNCTQVGQYSPVGPHTVTRLCKKFDRSFRIVLSQANVAKYIEGIRFVGKTSEHGSTMLVGYGEITCLQTTDGRFKPLLRFLVCG